MCNFREICKAINFSKASILFFLILEKLFGVKNLVPFLFHLGSFADRKPLDFLKVLFGFSASKCEDLNYLPKNRLLILGLKYS